MSLYSSLKRFICHYWNYIIVNWKYQHQSTVWQRVSFSSFPAFANSPHVSHGPTVSFVSNDGNSLLIFSRNSHKVRSAEQSIMPKADPARARPAVTFQTRICPAWALTLSRGFRSLAMRQRVPVKRHSNGHCRPERKTFALDRLPHRAPLYSRFTRSLSNIHIFLRTLFFYVYETNKDKHVYKENRYT